MKVFVTVALAFSIAFSPAHLSLAAETDDEREFALQLQAIAGYIERTFALQNRSPLTSGELRTSIRAASDWLATAQEESGHFRYEYAPYADEYLEDDNIVRQAGALYELGELARRDHDDSLEHSQTIERAIGYFETLTEADELEGEAFSCITQSERSSRCKLGATSLALAGILGYLKQHPEKTDEYDDLIDSYTAYLLASKKEGTGFRNYHYVGRTVQRDDESSFSNGEALLALVRYYQWNPREDVKVVIDETFAFLSTQEFDAPLYLWVMAALKDMHVLWPNDEYGTYAEAYTNWRTDTTGRYTRTKNNYCAYSEGLASAYSVLSDTLTTNERATLREELDYWNAKNVEFQIGTDDTYRVVERDGTLSLQKLQEPTRARGGFLTAEDSLTQRIDYTQHCISASLQTLVDIEGEPL